MRNPLAFGHAWPWLAACLGLALLPPAPLAAGEASAPGAAYVASVVYASSPGREGADHWLRLYALEDGGARHRDHEPSSLGLKVNELSFGQRESHRYDFRVYGRALYILDFDRSGSPTMPSGYWVNEGGRILVFEIGADLGLVKRAELLLMAPGRRTRTDEQFYQELLFLERGVAFTQWSVMTKGVKVMKAWTLGSDPLSPTERVFRDESAEVDKGSFEAREMSQARLFMALLCALGGDIAAFETARVDLDRLYLDAESIDIRPYGPVLKIGDKILDPRTGLVSDVPKDEAGQAVYAYHDYWIRPDRAYLKAGGRDYLVASSGSSLVCYDITAPSAPVKRGALDLGSEYERRRLSTLSDGLAVVNERGYLSRILVEPDGTMSAAWDESLLLSAMRSGDAEAVGHIATAMVDPRHVDPDGKSLFAMALELGVPPRGLEAFLDAALQVYGQGSEYGGFDARSCLLAALEAGDRMAAKAVIDRFPGTLEPSDASHLAREGRTATLGILLDLAPGLLAGSRTDDFGPLNLLYEASDEATRRLLLSLGAQERTKLGKPYPVYCVDQDVRIRSAPSLEAGIVGKAGYGEEFFLLGRSNLAFTSGGLTSTWIEIRLPSGQVGWTFGAYYSRTRPPR